MSDILSELLENYLRRRALGEAPDPEEYRERAGPEYARFVELLSTESALDAAMEVLPEEPLPRPFGAYTLLAELGRGAAGVVYEALHRGLGRTVALKVLRTGFDVTPDAIERFKREAVASAQVRHDHIVEVYEAGEAEGRPYYSMTLLRGRSLAQLARDGEIPGPRELCRGLVGVADALHELHQRGIVHRDVKPSNIIVEAGGRMVLADFGLARTVASEQLTRTGESLGTPLYMSPEQLLGRRDEINGRTDVYGLGATMYELLAGQPVFRAADLRELMRNILEARPRSMREIRPEIPRECDRIVLKAIEKENRDRYEDAAALRDDLRAFAEGAAVSGRPVSPVTRGVRRLRRSWLPLTAAAAVLAGIGIWYLSRPATLELASIPTAEVLLDGEHRGDTPLRLSLRPGEHTLALRAGGLKELTRPLRLSAGETYRLDLVLVAEDQDDPEVLRRFGAALDLVMSTELDDFPRHRGVGGSAVEVAPLYPRGDVRLEDLREYRIDVGAEFEAAGTLEFRVGRKTLHAEPFDPENLRTVAAVPKAVLDELKSGQTVTWGFHPEKKGARPVTAKFKLVRPDLQRRLARIEKTVGAENPVVARHLRAQLYLNKRLFLAAYLEARAVFDSHRESGQACVIMQQALRGMKLVESPLWEELRGATDQLPERVRSRVSARNGVR